MRLKFRLSKQESFKLLLICALPVHFWTILITFSSAETLITERDLIFTIGYSGYLFGLALLESLLLFGFVSALTFLFPKSWQGKTPFLVAVSLGLVTALWAIGNETFFMLTEASPPWFEWLRLRVHYRQQMLYPILWLVVIVSAALPLVTIPRFGLVRAAFDALAEKLILLAPLYLLFDLVGIGFMIARNLR